MATIVNARDVILQAAGSRLVTVTVGTSQNFVGSIAGTAAATVVAGAANGTTALSGLSDKISRSAATITSSGFQQQSSGYAGGTGYAYFDNGAIYKYGGVTILTIDLAGGVFAFKGDISGSTGTFYGNLNTNGTVYAYGATSFGGYAAAIVANSVVSGNKAILAQSLGDGILALAPQPGCDAIVGVCGTGRGVVGTASSGVGVRAVSSTGTALEVAGTMTITSATAVTNLNADLLDGNHASAFATVSHTHTLADIATSGTGYKFQYSTDGVSWTNIYLKRVDW